MDRSIIIHEGDRAVFRNLTDVCVGTGRLDLGLQAEYINQLQAVQDLCHFQYIRGHGLFSDQMGIYQERKRPDGAVVVEYCFTYLDRVFDGYRQCHIRPFLELGFMPKALAAGEQTLFYWQAHTTPPRDMTAWTDLVQATLRHLIHRYGRDEVALWPCEIWNEPNLRGFWENADKGKYLELYRATALAVKEVLPEMRVGGPAICGGEGSQQWIADFLTFCRDNSLPLDFVTRHAYMAETPEYRGRYVYHTMMSTDALIDEMRASREIIDRFPEYRGMPMYITEFNTSYNPRCIIHDTNANAAICAELLARLGDVSDGYSYWTFGDVFEETGIAPRPFHGGFGLMANGMIPKPTLWTFAFFASLRGEAVYRDGNAVIVRRDDGGYEGVLFNRCDRGGEEVNISLCVPVGERAAALIERVDAERCNPLAAWHRMGENADLTQEQLAFLRASAQPACETVAPVIENGMARINIALTENAVVRVRVIPAPVCDDDGYDYGYYCND